MKWKFQFPSVAQNKLKAGITTFVIVTLMSAVLWNICKSKPELILYLLGVFAAPTVLCVIRLLYIWLKDN